MDWHSWLSKSSLEPTFIHEYALNFTRNELQEDDLAYFNHEFLQSIGINIAKHRLEIIKLALKELRGKPNGISRIILAMKNAKNLFTSNIVKWGSHKNLQQYPVSGFSPFRTPCNPSRRRIDGGKDKGRIHMSIMRSGPLERRVQEKFLVTSRSWSGSGPVNGKIQERLWSPHVTRPMEGKGRDQRMGFTCRSPAVSGPMDRFGLSPKVSPFNAYDNSTENLGVDCGDQSLWYLMFQDIKPT
ncbi:hypothetical protein F511_43253 [Dorcoceras hygrometricum]|uniref:SAM domain-containing protein n=1 Tax=Dorcoceras hygrometricum TaxID=472368 RepID=A0A2Z6ZYN0_9LAMI|nr:hypothetical protein F511_43253 [Dorcoceras hygrometricum]